MDRQKLSHVVLEHLRQREHENKGWKATLKFRASRWWGRFGALAVWEKGIIAASAVLIIMALPVAVFALSNRGGGDESAVVAPTYQRPNYTPIPTSTPYINLATPKPIGIGGSPLVPTELPTEEPINRRDCDAIKGTPYESEEERDWYAVNCPADDGGNDNGGNGGPSQPPTQPPTNPPPPPPAPTSTPVQGLTAAAAKALGANFLGVSSGSCTVTNAGAHWRVTCAVGGETVSVCVFEQPLLIDYC